MIHSRRRVLSLLAGTFVFSALFRKAGTLESYLSYEPDLVIVDGWILRREDVRALSNAD
jgi:hypothetical protein